MSKRLIYAEDAIDALAKGNWGVDWDKALAEAIIKDLPSAQPDEQCDNCHYKHIWMTQRMNGNGFFGHGGATG